MVVFPNSGMPVLILMSHSCFLLGKIHCFAWVFKNCFNVSNIFNTWAIFKTLAFYFFCQFVLISKSRKVGTPLHLLKCILQWPHWLLALLETIYLFIEQIDTEFLPWKAWDRCQRDVGEQGMTPSSKSLLFSRKRDRETGRSNTPRYEVNSWC